MKYHCPRCKIHIWTTSTIVNCIVCKELPIEFISWLDYENSDVEVAIKIHGQEKDDTKTAYS